MTPCEVAVTSATAGHIAEIGFTCGQRVSQGEVLLRLDMDETRLLYLEAQVEYENAKKAIDDLDRWETGTEVTAALRSLSKAQLAMEGVAADLKQSAFLLDEGLVPASQHEDARRRYESQLLDLEAARQNLDAVRAKGGDDARRVANVNLEKARSRLSAVEAALAQDTVVAPISGVVQMPATPEGTLVRGLSVEKGNALLTIADVDRLAVLAQIDEVEVTAIRPGQPVTVQGDAFPDLVLRGVVRHVSQQPRASKPTGGVPLFTLNNRTDRGWKLRFRTRDDNVGRSPTATAGTDYDDVHEKAGTADNWSELIFEQGVITKVVSIDTHADAQGDDGEWFAVKFVNHEDNAGRIVFG